MTSRFISVGAENILYHPRSSAQYPVHPRRCGEHRDGLPVNRWEDGSSPQVRGTCQRPLWGGVKERFIPAGAGNILPETSYYIKLLLLNMNLPHSCQLRSKL